MDANDSDSIDKVSVDSIIVDVEMTEKTLNTTEDVDTR